MLSLRDRINFLDRGYVIVPNVFRSSEIQQLRAALQTFFATPASSPGDYDERGTLGAVRFDPFNRVRELAWVLGHPPLVSSLKALLGDDFLFLPEMSAHRGGFGDWHKDTTQQEKAGFDFQWSPTFAMVEAAIYLQDNGEWGGGLDVIEGSHRQPDRWVSERSVVEQVRARLERRRLLPQLRGRSVPSQAGDLVIFDFRLDHKASWPKRRGAIPEGHQKYALFLACSAKNSHVDRYAEFIARREDYAFLREHRYSPDVQSSGGPHLYSIPLPTHSP